MLTSKAAARGYVITPKTRGEICRSIQTRGVWRGSRAGVKLAFTLSNSRKHQRVNWWAAIEGKEINGKDGNVFDAVQSIEAAVLEQLHQGKGSKL